MNMRNKIIATVLVIALLTGGIILASFVNKQNSTAVSTVTISLNPEVQCVLNSSDKIISVNFLNSDGEILLYNQKLEGKSIEQFVQYYTELSIKAGYVNCNAIAENSDNIVEFKIICKDSEIQSRLNNKITENINKVFSEQAVFGKAREIEVASYDNLIEKYDSVVQNLHLNVVELDNLTESEILQVIKSRSEELNGIRASFIELLAPENLNTAIKALISQIENLKETLSEIQYEVEQDNSNTVLVKQLTNLEIQFSNVQAQLQQKYSEFIDQLKVQSTDYLKTTSTLLNEKIEAYKTTLENYYSSIAETKNEIIENVKNWQNQ